MEVACAVEGPAVNPAATGALPVKTFDMFVACIVNSQEAIPAKDNASKPPWPGVRKSNAGCGEKSRIQRR